VEFGRISATEPRAENSSNEWPENVVSSAGAER
jgi:hypothetical protein